MGNSHTAIVVDDVSPDHKQVRQVVEKFDNPRVRLVRHETNRGLAAARNTGYAATTAEFLYCVDADDKIEPDCLEALMSVITKEDDLDCIFGDVRLFGRVKGVITFPGPGEGKLVLRSEDTIPGAGTLLRKSFWERVGKYDEAEQLYRRALQILEEVRGPDHIEVASTLNNLAFLYVDQARYVEAEPMNLRALAIREATLGTNDLNTAASMNNLAALYEAIGSYNQGEPLALRRHQSTAATVRPSIVNTMR